MSKPTSRARRPRASRPRSTRTPPAAAPAPETPGGGRSKPSATRARELAVQSQLPGDEYGGDDVDLGSREHYADAELYDYEYRRRRTDVSFYVDLAKRVLGGKPGPILELACGSGRLTVPLVRAGHSVVGLDLSTSMLQRMAARLTRLGGPARARTTLIRADMRQFALGTRFPLIVMAFNSFEHLYTRVDVSQCLERVREHLAPGGLFVFDVQNPSLPWLCRDPDKRWAKTKFTHPVTGERLLYSTNHEYDPVSQIALIRLYYEPLEPGAGVPRVVTLSQRKFFPAELEALLHASGFTVPERYGDFAGQPLHGEHESQVLVCRPRPAAPSRPGTGQQPVSKGSAAAALTAKPEANAGTEPVCRLGIARDGQHLYYLQNGELWRMPHDRRSAAEKLAVPISEPDPGYVYFVDKDGHIARVPRP